MIEDLSQLSVDFYRRWRHKPREPVILNPTFAGSKYVGGADADFILDGTLIELRTSQKPRPVERTHLWQLLGYVLLDFDNEHNIQAVGFDFVRHRVTRSWPVDRFAAMLSGSVRPLVDWRREMQEHCKLLAWPWVWR